jgi:hypothetical protein
VFVADLDLEVEDSSKLRGRLSQAGRSRATDRENEAAAAGFLTPGSLL